MISISLILDSVIVISLFTSVAAELNLPPNKWLIALDTRSYHIQRTILDESTALTAELRALMVCRQYLTRYLSVGSMKGLSGR